MNYKDALQSDLAVIVEIYNSTISARMVTADTELVNLENRQKWFEEHYSRRPLWIVENDDYETVGWISFQSFYGRPAYDATVEISIYLHTAQRGKGLGRGVLQHCIDHATPN